MVDTKNPTCDEEQAGRRVGEKESPLTCEPGQPLSRISWFPVLLLMIV